MAIYRYKDVFETNITLTKIIWRLQSRSSFALNKLITRNGEIQRRIAVRSTNGAAAVLPSQRRC